jgi:hypothetical protein
VVHEIKQLANESEFGGRDGVKGQVGMLILYFSTSAEDGLNQRCTGAGDRSSDGVTHEGCCLAGSRTPKHFRKDVQKLEVSNTV